LEVAAPLWAGLVPVLRSVRLELSLANLEPLRIGIGERVRLGEAINLPVLKERVYYASDGVARVVPVIPGSSLKGVLRTATMTALTACGIEAHSGVKSDNCVVRLCDGVKLFEDLRKSMRADVVRAVVAGFCPACLLYGTPSVSSRLRVGEFVPEPSTVRLGVKTGVGIDRRSGASANVIYTVEYVEPGTVFSGVVTAVNTPNWLLALFARSLLLLDEGWLKIGGFKSRGMGLVSLLKDRGRLVVEGAVARDVPALEVLDGDVDRVEELPGCRTDEEGRLVCEGPGVYEALRRFAAAWDGFYCQRLPEVLERRREAARQVCRASVAGGEA